MQHTAPRCMHPRGVSADATHHMWITRQPRYAPLAFDVPAHIIVLGIIGIFAPHNSDAASPVHSLSSFAIAVGISATRNSVDRPVANEGRWRWQIERFPWSTIALSGCFGQGVPCMAFLAWPCRSAYHLLEHATGRSHASAVDPEQWFLQDLNCAHDRLVLTNMRSAPCGSFCQPRRRRLAPLTRGS